MDLNGKYRTNIIDHFNTEGCPVFRWLLLLYLKRPRLIAFENRTLSGIRIAFENRTIPEPNSF